jgi:hypothetical protein
VYSAVSNFTALHEKCALCIALTARHLDDGVEKCEDCGIKSYLWKFESEI